MNVGIIVEGGDDRAVYPVLIRRIDATVDGIHARECGGRRKLEDKFVVFLKQFAGNLPAFRIKKVLVIRDSDCEDPSPIERKLQRILGESRFEPPFGVSFHATKCKLESWLLADEAAINFVSNRRGGPGAIRRVEVDLENFREPDQLYRKTLSQAGLQDTEKVMREIAEQARLEVIAQHCPTFRHFTQKLTDP